MAFTTITLTGHYEDPQGGNATGEVQFQLTNSMSQGGGPVVAATGFTATLTAGAFSVELYATDDVATSPLDTAYKITELINGSPAIVYYIIVPHTASDGTIDITQCPHVLPSPYTTTNLVTVAGLEAAIAAAIAAGGGGGGGDGDGSVISVSFNNVNGFVGTVTNPDTTPDITLGTTVNGIVKGNGTAISVATPGTDYLAPTGNGSGLTGITHTQVGADVSGAAATAQSNAETFATTAVAAETARAEAAEAGLAGGGGDGGAPFIKSFQFNYASSDLTTGHQVYVPTVGEVIFRAWFSISTPFDGITPSGDFGQLQGTGLGNMALGQPFGAGVAVMSAQDVSSDGSGAAGMVGPAAGVGGAGIWEGPVVCASTEPLCIVVSQDGNATTATASLTAKSSPSTYSITADVNDQFQFGPSSDLVTCTIQSPQDPTTISNIATMATAMTNALSIAGFNVTVTASGSVLLATANSGGAWATGLEFQEGNGFLAASGFAAGVGLTGGTGGNPGSTVGTGTFYLASSLASSSAPEFGSMFGLYVGNVANPAAAEALLDVSSVPWLMSFVQGSTTETMLTTGTPDVTDIATWATGLGGRLIAPFNMLPSSGVTATEAASGGMAATATSFGEALVANGQANAIVRIGWEFNGNWFPWGVEAFTSDAMFLDAWSSIAEAFLAVEGQEFLLFWNPTIDQSTDWSSRLPPSGQVHVIGPDLYNQVPGSWVSDASAWNSYLTAPTGLDMLADLATANGLRLGIGEWGLGYNDTGVPSSPDDPTFVNNTIEWCEANNVLFCISWCYGAAADQLPGTDNPLSTAEIRTAL